ncbi:MAG: hypothetical protein A2041_09505 [Bacteroidetes bacterium GWA2_31_9b]|nr:MAG: hypothetical protein A2041_09505 [Bacteroidetes bacterium GWA2_31_9b]
MNKVLLDYLMRLFAILSTSYPSVFIDNIKQFIRLFLINDFPSDVLNKYILIFDDYVAKYNEESKSANKIIFLESEIREIVKQINKEIPKKLRILILIRLILFEKFITKYTTTNKQQGEIAIREIVNMISGFLKIPEVDYFNINSFIFEKPFELSNKQDLLIVGGKKIISTNIPFIEHENLQGQFYFLRIPSVNIILFYYKGSAHFQLNNQVIFSENIYPFLNGSSINGDTIEPIYYNKVLHKYLSDQVQPFQLCVENLHFQFKNSNNGIHDLTFALNAGQMMGIIGKSGVGKSTLLNLLNGTISPQNGSIRINQYQLKENDSKLEGLIGYIPQDDLLVEDLTVFENLFLNSKLCLGNLSTSEITEKVYNLLIELDLFEICNLKVGSPLNKFISGGQRKRLNIALELIREPWILYADEPTSGLSSTDADDIMRLFVEQTIKGRIVVMNIHQPSSENFKLFDQILVLDYEGHPVYFGNPVNSINYFNTKTGSFIRSSDSCNKCGNINHEAIFRILGEKKIDEFGNRIEERKISHKQWHQFFLETVRKKDVSNSEKQTLPKIQFSKPGKLNQFLIFSKRNILSKLANKQYILLAMLVSPILALMLSLLCRSGTDPNSLSETYIFAFNENIPSYLFMSVIVALFVGLIISAEEIYKDRNILKRETFLKLNRNSYLYSKISFLIFLSLIQTLLYVIIGNLVLEIKGMFFIYWLILFSTSCFANAMGLFISSIFNSVVVIYILVPILIVPQLLLSGIVVQYDKLNKYVVSQNYVPPVGDLMASRWAYEALVVSQFRFNAYQKNYFEIEKRESNVKFNLIFVIPELKTALNNIRESDNISNLNKNNIELLKNEIYKLNKNININIKGLNNDNFDKQTWNEINTYLNSLKNKYQIDINKCSLEKDDITHKLLNKYNNNNQAFTDYKNKYHNKNIADIVLNRNNFETFTVYKSKIVRKIEPIYQIPDSKTGRSQFYASSKMIGNLEMNTLIFNFIIIWLMTLFTLIILIVLFKRKIF